MTQTKICKLNNGYTVPKDIVDYTMLILNELDKEDAGDLGLVVLKELYNYTHRISHELNSEIKELLSEIGLLDQNLNLPKGEELTINAAVILFHDIPCIQDPVVEIIGLDAKL
jgi:hypothetical protein